MKHTFEVINIEKRYSQWVKPMPKGFEDFKNYYYDISLKDSNNIISRTNAGNTNIPMLVSFHKRCPDILDNPESLIGMTFSAEPIYHKTKHDLIIAFDDIRIQQKINNNSFNEKDLFDEFNRSNVGDLLYVGKNFDIKLTRASKKERTLTFNTSQLPLKRNWKKFDEITIVTKEGYYLPAYVNRLNGRTMFLPAKHIPTIPSYMKVSNTGESLIVNCSSIIKGWKLKLSSFNGN